MADVEIDYTVLQTVIDAFTEVERVLSDAAGQAVPSVDSEDPVAADAAPAAAAAATALLRAGAHSCGHGRAGAQAAYDGFKHADGAN
ncbi:hypothetical protein [Arthrobacter antioxidans]|uniref:hypothetical protein n=1 Tax=Arthrobacter antioxidans TaxID=2895818 RepID=UPI00200013AA|nr:hypothetical protein [Arthrobacter antioxidans]